MTTRVRLGGGVHGNAPGSSMPVAYSPGAVLLPRDDGLGPCAYAELDAPGAAAPPFATYLQGSLSLVAFHRSQSLHSPSRAHELTCSGKATYSPQDMCPRSMCICSK